MNDPITDGERWAADALTALRDARYAPAAIGAFLNRSRERAADTRARRAGLAAQARRWSSVALAATLVLREAAARGRRPVPARTAVLGGTAIEALMLDWHLGMVQGPAGETRERLSAADALTLARGTLAPFAAAAPPDVVWFLLLLGAAGASDLLDGALARRTGTTRLGRDFDPIADLAFRAAAVRGARREGWIDATAARALTARQLALIGGAALYWLGGSHRPPRDPRGLARWDAPPLLAGLALGALGRRREGNALVIGSAALGALGLLRAAGRPERQRTQARSPVCSDGKRLARPAESTPSSGAPSTP